jgi:hypothetical protein
MERQSINRRTFLAGTGAAATLAAIPTHLHATTTPPLTSLTAVNMATNANITLTANGWANKLTTTDAQNESVAQNAQMIKDGFDTQLKTVARTVSLAKFMTTRPDLTPYVNKIKVYQPTYTLAAAQAAFNRCLPTTQGAWGLLLENLQYNGFSPVAASAANYYAGAATAPHEAGNYIIANVNMCGQGADLGLYFAGAAIVVLIAATGVGAIAEGAAWGTIITYGTFGSFGFDTARRIFCEGRHRE